MGFSDTTTRVLLVLIVTVWITATVVRCLPHSHAHNLRTRSEDDDDDVDDEDFKIEWWTKGNSYGICMAHGLAAAKSKQHVKDSENLIETTESTETIKQLELEEEIEPLLEHLKKIKYSRGKGIEMSEGASKFINKSGKHFKNPHPIKWGSDNEDGESPKESKKGGKQPKKGKCNSRWRKCGESMESSEETESSESTEESVPNVEECAEIILQAKQLTRRNAEYGSLMDNKRSTKESKRRRATEESGDKRRETDHTISKRYIAANVELQWPKALIPYVFTDEINKYKRVEFLRAMQKYSYWSCIRFAEFNTTISETTGHGNYLNFIKGQGCYAVFGNTYGDGQKISGCSETVVVHEIGHALGLFHEHTKSIRDQHIRIDYENFAPPGAELFYKKDPKMAMEFDYYNLQSTMHYHQWANSKNKRDVFIVLDEEMQYLISEKERTYYYLFKEIQDAYNCKVNLCPDFSITCENGGYFSFIRGECTCRCPIGLNPLTGCTTQYTGDELAKSMSWPDGTFSILKIHGQNCPPGFDYGWIKHWSAADILISTPYNCADIGSDKDIVHEFCTKSDPTPHADNLPLEWEKGSYCILKKGDCPQGFEDGSVQFYDRVVTDHSNSSFGELPDLMSGQDVVLNFCCRNDSDIEDPIKLPTNVPLILFQESMKGCQEVIDMIIEYEYFSFKNRINVEDSQKTGHVPYITKQGYRRFLFQFCYYQPIVIESGCGGIIDLTDDTLSADISSPNYPANYQKCTWFVKSAPNSKIILNFYDFDFESVDGICTDTLEIRYSLPGHRGKIYCGEGFQKTIISQENSLSLTMTTHLNSGSGFLANVRMQKLDVDNLCYRYEDGGSTYRGMMNYTRQFRKCLPWIEVLHCPHNPFAVGDYDDGLDSNYCRNPGFGYAPWCYYKAEGCKREYCDVCSSVRCYDLFNDCANYINEDPSYCENDDNGEATRGCVQSCGRREQQLVLPVVSEVKCQPPLCVPESTSKLEYSVGETVTYQCSRGAEIQEIVCLGNGSWSGGIYVCGACPNGFTYRNGTCYKWFDDFVTKVKADLECSRYNAIISPAKTEEDFHFLTSLIIEERSFWIGLTDTEVENTFKWEDGTELDWSNWATKQPNDFGMGQDCVVVSYKKRTWDDVICDAGDFHSFICALPQSDLGSCQDRQNDCASKIMAVPDACSQFPQFAHEVCPASCSQCLEAAVNCSEPELPVNAIKETPDGSLIQPGNYFNYSCKSGYSLGSGNLVRACLMRGELTGAPPACLADNEVETPNNAIDMRSRQFMLAPTIAVTSENKTTASAMSIHKTGNITEWIMYSNYNTSLTLQVYRPMGNFMFLLVGQNFIQSTKDDRITQVKITKDKQIAVKKGDQIGIHYGSTSGGIAYDICKTEFDPGAGVLVIDKRQKVMTTGQKYLFKTTTYRGICRLYSVTAFVL